MPADLIAFFGVETRDDGQLRAVGAYALHAHGKARGRLLWHDTVDFLPDGPMATVAPARIVDGLRANLAVALDAWAAMLEESNRS